MSSRSAPAPGGIAGPSYAGAAAAGLASVVTLLTWLVYVQVPEEQQLLAPAGGVLSSIDDGARALPVWLWLLVVQGVAGLGVVPAATRRVGAGSDGLRWAAALAGLGYAALVVGALLVLTRFVPTGRELDPGDDAARAAVAALWPPTLDAWGLLVFGAVGVWSLALSVAGLRSRVGGRGVWSFGLALGTGQLLTCIGLASGGGALFDVGLFVVTLAGTAWFGGLAALLFREPDLAAPAGSGGWRRGESNP